MISPPEARGMAAMERMSALPLQETAKAPPERMGLMALAEVQPGPAGPCHRRQVATSNWVSSIGSTRNGAGRGMASPSPATSASLTTGVVPKAEVVQGADCEHR